MLRNVSIAALHNAMLCSAMLRQLCFVLVLRYALLHYGTFVKLCYSTLRYLCFVTLVTLYVCYVMLLLVTFITLPYATPWQAVALWYAMLRYDMLYYVTVICAVFLRVVD